MPISSKARVRSEAAAMCSSLDCGLGVDLQDAKTIEERRNNQITRVLSGCLVFKCLVFSIGGKIVGSVEINIWAANFVSLQHSERWGIYVNRDQILSTNIGVTQLVNIRYACSSYFTSGTFPCCSVTKAIIFVVGEHRFPHQTLLHFDHTMGAVVIVDWGPLSRSPTDNEHLHRFVSTNTVAPVVAFLEAQVWL